MLDLSVANSDERMVPLPSRWTPSAVPDSMRD